MTPRIFERGGLDKKTLEAEVKALRDELDKKNKRLEQLTRGVSPYCSGYHITDEQIDALWELMWRNPEQGYRALRLIGIVACKECGGWGRVPTPTTYAIETGGWDESCPRCAKYTGHGWIREERGDE